MKKFAEMNRDDLREYARQRGYVGYGKLGAGGLRIYLQERETTATAVVPTVVPADVPKLHLVTQPVAQPVAQPLVQVDTQPAFQPVTQPVRDPFHFRTGNPVPVKPLTDVEQYRQDRAGTAQSERKPLTLITDVGRINRLIDEANQKGAERAKIELAPSERPLLKKPNTGYQIPQRKGSAPKEPRPSEALSEFERTQREAERELQETLEILRNPKKASKIRDYVEDDPTNALTKVEPVVPEVLPEPGPSFWNKPLSVVKPEATGEVHTVSLKGPPEDTISQAPFGWVEYGKPESKPELCFPKIPEVPSQVPEKPLRSDPSRSEPFQRGDLVRNDRNQEVGVVVWTVPAKKKAFVCWMGWKHPGEGEPSPYLRDNAVQSGIDYQFLVRIEESDWQ